MILGELALSGAERLFGKEGAKIPNVLIPYAESLQKQEGFEEALPLAERPLAIQNKALPPDDPDLEETYDLLFEIHEALGKTGNLKREEWIRERRAGDKEVEKKVE